MRNSHFEDAEIAGLPSQILGALEELLEDFGKGSSLQDETRFLHLFFYNTIGRNASACKSTYIAHPTEDMVGIYSAQLTIFSNHSTSNALIQVI